MGAPGEIRILRIITRLNVGGPAYQAVRLARRFNEGRFKTLLVAGTVGADEGSLIENARTAGVDLETVEPLGREISPLRDWKAYREIKSIVRYFRPHVIHTHTAKAGALGRLAAYGLRSVRLVHTMHGHVFRHYFGPLGSLAAVEIEKQLLRKTDVLIVPGESVRRELVRDFGFPEVKIRVVPLGLDLEPFINAKSGRFRTAAGIGSKKPLVGFTGRMVGVKDPLLFAETAAEVARHVPDARFAVAGDGPLMRPFHRRVRELGLAERFVCPGWVARMDDFLADLDVMVLTSRNEGTPLSIIEAMAAGTPVVAARVGGVEDLFVFRETGRAIIEADGGYLVGPRTPRMLAEAVIMVLENATRREFMSDLAREFVRENHSIERLFRDLENLYIEETRK